MEDSAVTSQSEKLKRVEGLFQAYRSEMDARHDLQEKLVKKSRDLLIMSKRVIFLLHRIKGTNESLMKEAEQHLQTLYFVITHDIGSLLISEDIYQYLRSFSSGIQEFVEALSFYYYLRFGRLVSLEEINEGSFLLGKSVGESKDNVQKMNMSSLLTPLDYILGVADLTGELMRKCIASGNLEEPFLLRTQLKHIYDAFLMIRCNSGKELMKKSYTLKASLQKVENACYTIRVRGSEFERLRKGGVVSTEKVFILADLFSPCSEIPVDDNEYS